MGADRVTSCLNAARTHILTVGSGDGSQPAVLVREGHRLVTATFFDSRDTVLAKYSGTGAAAHLELLERDAQEVHYGVDATALGSGPGPLGQECTSRFDVILFYFPHTGVTPGESGAAVASNRELVRRFLEATPRLLAPGGEVQLAVKSGQPYAKWDVKSLFQAVEKSHELRLLRSFPVNKAQFPGYVHRLTVGSHGHLKEIKNDGGALVYVLSLEDAGLAPVGHAGACPTRGGFLVTLVVLVGASLTDVEVEAGVLGALASPGGCSVASPTVLDLRRCFEESLMPDTRQLNRVVYELVKRGRVLRGAPLDNGRHSQKPTWKLVP